MQLALTRRKFIHFGRICLTLPGIFVVWGAKQGSPVELDIRRQSTSDEQSDRFPGYSVGYSSGGVMSGFYDLPLRIVTFIVTDNAGDATSLDCRITLLNASKSVFMFSSSLNAKRTEADGNRGRRELLFSIVGTANSQFKRTVVQTTYGSTSVPGSYRSLNPGQEIVVEFSARRSEIRPPTNMGQLTVVCECKEWTIADQAFTIIAESRPIFSPAITYDKPGR